MKTQFKFARRNRERKRTLGLAKIFRKVETNLQGSRSYRECYSNGLQKLARFIFILDLFSKVRNGLAFERVLSNGRGSAVNRALDGSTYPG